MLNMIKYMLLPTLFFITLMPFIHMGFYEAFMNFAAPDYLPQTIALSKTSEAYPIHLPMGALYGVLVIVQFSSRIRTSKPKLHRASGYLALLMALILNASGIHMAIDQPFAPSGGLMTVLLAITIPGLLFYGLGLVAALKKNFVQHRSYMILGTAFTGSIVLQRPTGMILEFTTDIPFNALFNANVVFCSILALWMARYFIKSSTLLPIRAIETH